MLNEIKSRSQSGPKKILKGEVISDKMDKTVIVLIESLREHPKYRKKYKITKKYKAHDEKNECKIGDIVEIIGSRPMSKEKRWKVIKKLGVRSKSKE